MERKELISIALLNNTPLYSVDDAWKVLKFSSIETALENVSATSVYTVESGKPDTKKLYYVDAVGLCNLLENSPHPSFAKISDQNFSIISPKLMKKNPAVNGVKYYPAQIILKITENESYEQTNCEILFSISEIAEEYNMTGHELNLYLEMKGVQRRIGKKWKVYSKYVKKHYTGTYKSNSYVYWTLDGKLFINTLLEEDNHVRKTANE